MSFCGDQILIDINSTVWGYSAIRKRRNEMSYNGAACSFAVFFPVSAAIYNWSRAYSVYNISVLA